MLKDARYFEKKNDKIDCLLCPHSCEIGPGQAGRCSVRIHEDGTLKTINYGEITAIALDPIEKKPLYYFHPGKNILSVGTFGCNFSCDFCQNYTIAQFRSKSHYLSSEDLIEKCLQADNNIGLAFTYNEPTIWYEYVYDTAKLLKENHPEQKVVLVTNGFINPKPLQDLLPYVDAMNIDLKAFTRDYYQKVCGGDLEPVLKTIETASQACHVEVTTLLVPGLNDSREEVEKLSRFLAGIDKNIPLHLSRYFPTYKMDLPATDVDVMKDRFNIAKKCLNHVHLGNVY